MRGLIPAIAISATLLAFCGSTANASSDDHSSIVIVYKNGHRQTLSRAEIQKIDFKAPAAIVYKDGRREKVLAEIERIEFSENELGSMTPGRNHYLGKWEVGDGGGNNFFITLEENGDAKKTHGSPHGTWTLVDGEAHISWDDGWHDVICKVGGKHEKRAYEPGKTFDDTPSNVTAARNTEAKPI